MGIREIITAVRTVAHGTPLSDFQTPGSAAEVPILSEAQKLPYLVYIKNAIKKIEGLDIYIWKNFQRPAGDARISKIFFSKVPVQLDTMEQHIKAIGASLSIKFPERDLNWAEYLELLLQAAGETVT